MTLLDFIFLTRIMHNTFIYITLNILDKSGVYRCFPQIHFHLRICPDFGNLLQCPFLKRIDFYQLTSNCGFQKLKFANEEKFLVYHIDRKLSKCLFWDFEMVAFELTVQLATVEGSLV